MKQTLTLLSFILSLLVSGQSVDPSKLVINNGYGYQYKIWKVDSALIIPHKIDTASKMPGQLKLLGNSLFFTGIDGTWRSPVNTSDATSGTVAQLRAMTTVTGKVYTSTDMVVGPWVDLGLNDGRFTDNGWRYIITVNGHALERQINGELDVKLFGAKCDYNPDTNTGADDTNAWIAAIAAAGNKYAITFDGGSKVTQQLTTNTATRIIGKGVTSFIWAALTDSTKSVIKLSNNTDPFTGIMKDFAIYGGTRAAFAALTCNTYYDFCTIDIEACGGFRYVFYESTTDPFETLSSGGQNSLVKLTVKLPLYRWPYGYGMIPYPNNGYYHKGYVNATDLKLDFQGIQKYFGQGGNGVTLIGNYSVANSSTLQATMQGVEGDGLIIDKTNGGLSVTDFYGEANGRDIVVTNSSNMVFNGRCFANVNISTSNNIDLTNTTALQGVFVDEATCSDIFTSRNESIAINNGDNVSTIKPMLNSAVGNLYGKTSKSIYDYRNYIANGDFSRSVGTTTWGSETPWGFDDIYGIVTKTGIGLPDTAHTFESKYAIKLETRPGYGWFLTHHLQIPLEGKLNNWLSISFKYKGTGFLEVTNNGNGNYENQNNLNWGIPVENGFKLVRYSFKITQAMINEGIKLNFNSNNGTLYLSELYAGFGLGSPHNFIPYQSGRFTLAGGNLNVSGTVKPTGGDPIYGQKWVVGDKISKTNITGTSEVGYVCYSAGTPGLWKPFGGIDFDSTYTAVELRARGNPNTGVAFAMPSGYSIRTGDVGANVYLDMGNVHIRDGDGSATNNSTRSLTVPVLHGRDEGVSLEINGPDSARLFNARGLRIGTHLIALNNDDTLIGQETAPVYDDNGHTGVVHIAQRFNAPVEGVPATRFNELPTLAQLHDTMVVRMATVFSPWTSVSGGIAYTGGTVSTNGTVSGARATQTTNYWRKDQADSAATVLNGRVDSIRAIFQNGGNLGFTSDGTSTAYTFSTTGMLNWDTSNKVFVTATSAMGGATIEWIEKLATTFVIHFSTAPTAGAKTFDYLVAQ